jgi:hypothetical protein
MKSLFPHPIGNLRDLGTRRQWITDAICIGICAAAVIIALIFL